MATQTDQQAYDAALVYFDTYSELISAQDIVDAYEQNQTDDPPLSGTVVMSTLRTRSTVANAAVNEYQQRIDSINARRDEVKPVLIQWFIENDTVTSITLDDGSLELVSDGTDITVQIP